MVGLCPLCKQERDLVKSHIVPKYLLRHAKQEPHGKVIVLKDDVRRSGWVSDIGYDYLLCGPCDGFIGKQYDEPFKLSWYDEGKCPPSTGGEEVAAEGTNYVLVRGLNYHQTKLFILSVLWRASVSKLPMFDTIHLGQKHEKCIRSMLLDGDGGSSARYFILGRAILTLGEIDHSVVWPPVPSQDKVDGRRIYAMIFAGVEWLVSVSSFAESRVTSMRLQEDGTMPFSRIELRDIPRVNESVRRHKAAEQLGIITRITSRGKK